MKTTTETNKAFTDALYYVSAADVADKILDRMQRGLNPLLFSKSSLAFIPVNRMLRTHRKRKLD